MGPKWASGAQPGLWLKLPTSLPLHSHGGTKAPLFIRDAFLSDRSCCVLHCPCGLASALGLVTMHPDLGFADSSLCIWTMFWRSAMEGWMCMRSWDFPSAESIWLHPEEGKDSGSCLNPGPVAGGNGGTEWQDG